MVAIIIILAVIAGVGIYFGFKKVKGGNSIGGGIGNGDNIEHENEIGKE